MFKIIININDIDKKTIWQFDSDNILNFYQQFFFQTLTNAIE